MANKSYEEMLFTALKNGQHVSKSVYDIWLELGNIGTPQDFLNSLKGTAAIIVNGFTIPPSMWEVADNIYKVTISNENITPNSIVNISFNSGSMKVAIESNLMTYTSSIDGAFEIYSKSRPTTDLVINYAIINE